MYNTVFVCVSLNKYMIVDVMSFRHMSSQVDKRKTNKKRNAQKVNISVRKRPRDESKSICLY